MLPVKNTKTIANVAVGLLDCKVHCSGRKTVFQSLKMVYDYCTMLPVRTSTAKLRRITSPAIDKWLKSE